MAEFFNNLPDGWTIYIWMIAAAAILIAAAFFLRWAAKNFQFDEDIKYVVFDETDKDKMSPEEYEKSREVNKAQEELRDEVKRKRAEQKRQRSAK
jgi:hypothetical protein